MRKFFVLALTLTLCLGLQAQVYMPITDNMVIPANSSIKFAAGNYVFSDVAANGVIQVNGVQNVILDGDSCRVNGLDMAGYMIMITNSANITIRNFDSVFGYKYAVYILNSQHITINGNVFCRNRVDSSGWIDVWADYSSALGGGVMMYQSRGAHIYGNVMTLQNDGVALYHCDSILIHDNDFSWNTSFGIRMFYSDTCHIYQNNCSHVNRPYTDPSDCAALLMIIANANRVEYNDLSYSGDGVFLGQYQHSNTPNNNYFAWNECSWSPHNAIEATFAGGNVYKHNKCNYSHYGLWLGYSFSSLVDSNEIVGNYQSGIAIDRGHANVVSGNLISNNPVGIELWQGTPATGYASFYSQDYTMTGNTFDGNTQAISSINTKHAVISGNSFDFSQSASLYLSGTSATDTITGNTFRMPTGYHIYNNSSNPKHAPGNLFDPADTAMISAKIYDLHDNAAKGEVVWLPQTPGPETPIQSLPPCDLAEPPARWYAYPEAGYPAPVKIPDTVRFDSAEKKIGAASVKLVTSRGWDMMVNYRPGGDSLAQWALTDQDTLYFWVRCIKQPQYGFQYFSVRIGDDRGNYYKYTASPGLLNASHLVWKQYKVPLSGNTQFVRSTTGAMSAGLVNYVEIHADTWDYGFTLWVDGVQFAPCTPVTSVEPVSFRDAAALSVYPNPTPGAATLSFFMPAPGPAFLELIDSRGKKVRDWTFTHLPPGEQRVEWKDASAGSCLPGIYLVRLVTSSGTSAQKVILAR